MKTKIINFNKILGFTLIELMIVIVIIGIISSIALPIYQRYIIHTQLTRAVSEMDLTRADIDNLLLDGAIPTTDDHHEGYINNGQRMEFIGVYGPKSSHPKGVSNLFDSIYVNTDDLNQQKFTTLVGIIGKDATSTIHGIKIIYTRDTNGVWLCKLVKPSSLYWNKRWTPVACSTIISIN